jgi:mannose-6-phosphate isomerase
MHFLEACLAAFEIFEEPAYLDTAAGLVEIFLDRLFQTREGALPEFFDDGLRPIRERGLFRVEPGHHFEWIWLIDGYRRAMAKAGRFSRPELGAAFAALEGFAARFGLDAATGLAVDGLWSDGTVETPGFRLWPQTERIKSAARSATEPVTSTNDALLGFRRFLAGAPPGLWHERLDAAGAPIPGPSPATSLYHITCALTDEAARARYAGSSRTT